MEPEACSLWHTQRLINFLSEKENKLTYDMRKRINVRSYWYLFNETDEEHRSLTTMMGDNMGHTERLLNFLMEKENKLPHQFRRKIDSCSNEFMDKYMKFVINNINSANNVMDGVYSYLTGDNLVGLIVSVCLVLYGGMAGPELPTVFKRLFENTYFKFLILSLVAYSSVKDYKVALLLAFAFTFSISMFDILHFDVLWLKFSGPKAQCVFDNKNSLKGHRLA